jgi:hypothetical protein
VVKTFEPSWQQQSSWGLSSVLALVSTYSYQPGAPSLRGASPSKYTPLPPLPQGHRIGLCRPLQPRVTASLPCVLGQSYNGVQVEDCITYQSGGAPVENQAPYCFTGANNTGKANCVIDNSCTHLDMHSCPSNPPAPSATDFTLFTPACIEQVRSTSAPSCVLALFYIW